MFFSRFSRRRFKMQSRKPLEELVYKHTTNKKIDEHVRRKERRTCIMKNTCIKIQSNVTFGTNTHFEQISSAKKTHIQYVKCKETTVNFVNYWPTRIWTNGQYLPNFSQHTHDPWFRRDLNHFTVLQVARAQDLQTCRDSRKRSVCKTCKQTSFLSQPRKSIERSNPFGRLWRQQFTANDQATWFEKLAIDDFAGDLLPLLRRVARINAEAEAAAFAGCKICQIS